MKILLAFWSYADDALLERSLADPADELILKRLVSGEPLQLSSAEKQSIDALVNYSAVEKLPFPPTDFPNCKIAVRAGVGFDNLDRPGWGSQGVPVCNVPDYGTTEVADHAIALMLSLARGTAPYHRMLSKAPREGWRFADAPLIRRLRGAVFGVIGLGRIGTAAALRAQAFGMQIVFFDPHLPSGVELALGFQRVHDLKELTSQADVLSIHTPLDESTHGLINQNLLHHSKPGQILVNTARGQIVDLDAVHEALESEKLGGAGLDVLPEEPANPAHPLIQAYQEQATWLEGRLILTPHAAFYSPSSVEDLRRKSFEVTQNYLSKKILLNCVNSEYLRR
jgi:lactate dehydrogenase-like 2-hydroxyacid dehydrogenase